MTKISTQRTIDVTRLVPPAHLRNWTGPFDDVEWYLSLGKGQAEKLIEWMSIKPDQTILDLGCGCGRLSVHLIHHMNSNGRLLGLDCNKDLVDWCSENITPLVPNFQFSYIDVYNGIYARNGCFMAEVFTFPLEPDSIDAAFLWSVFTHMYMNDIRGYLKELYRVLKPGSSFVASLNVHNERIAMQIQSGNAALDIRHKVNEESFTLNADTPEDGFAHNEQALKGAYEDTGFVIREIQYGVWSDKTISGEFHDCILATKTL